MRTKLLSSVKLLFLLMFSLFVFTTCSDKCRVTSTYVYYEPVYSTTAEVKAAVEQQAPHSLTGLGKIYFKDNYLFINETGKGIHIIDNHNPAQPQPLSFLNIPGNYDLAAIGNILYADSYVDLVVFDISDIQHIKEVNRMESLFNNYTTMGMLVGTSKGVITDWKRMDNVNVYKRECDQELVYGGIYYDGGIAMSNSQSATFNSKAAIAPVSTTGIGGSMARFTIKDDHLYALDGSKLDIVDVNAPRSPKAKNEITLQGTVETIFPYKNNLFFGTQTGMLIYDLKNEENPSLLGKYEHVRTCDPVVVQDNYAYVTLRSGSFCGGFTNQLEVIDITNLSAPSSVKICPMTNPYGLGIDGKTLFVCDGTSGLKVYDASDISKICDKQLAHYDNINALDIIPYHNIAMMIGKDGLYQYDYSKPAEIKFLSVLPIAQ